MPGVPHVQCAVFSFVSHNGTLRVACSRVVEGSKYCTNKIHISHVVVALSG